MSASLVGSEMCIRDRGGRARPPPGRGGTGPPKCPHPPRSSGFPGGPPPVSYTHLTLPTICSV
eukprot:15201895-Alexandrium_andersonii.AAC.1